MENIELFNQDIKEFLRIPNDKSTFEERVGLPDELSSVIGRITMNFSALEDTLSECIIKVIGQSNAVGQIITAELSFKNKINLFSSLYFELKDRVEFNAFPGLELEHFKEIIKALNKCEILRNEVIHSTFSNITRKVKDKVIRKKVSAKQKIGLKVINEETDVIKLFNIADFIVVVAYGLDEFCITIVN